MAVQYIGHMIQTETCDNDTALPLVEVPVTSRYLLYYLLYLLKMKNYLIQIVIGANLSPLGFSGILFSLD